MPCSATSPRRANAVVSLAPVGGEAQVAHQRLHQADPRARAVDGGDDRLWDRQREGLRAALQGGLGVDVDLAVAERLQILHVRARAEAAAGARHHDHADLLSLGALLEHSEVDALHLRGPRVQAIGPVERQQRHTVLDLPLHHFAHVDSSHFFFSPLL